MAGQENRLFMLYAVLIKKETSRVHIMGSQMVIAYEWAEPLILTEESPLTTLPLKVNRTPRENRQSPHLPFNKRNLRN